MPKKLLIVSYTFPPTSGIGGRRWAKFAKYLKRKGYDLTVLAADISSEQKSEWTSDIDGLNIERIPTNYPSIVSNPQPGLINKFKYFATIKKLQLLVKGNYFDRTALWKESVQSKISDLIKSRGINCVIVTGGPFQLTHHVSSLKPKFPKVKFIVDFRDLWTQDSEITFFSVMPQSRKALELEMEKQTVQWADQVITTMESMSDYYSNLTDRDKIHTITNGFDKDDFSDLKNTERDNKDEIIFTYAGTLYLNLHYVLDPFFAAIGKIKTEKPDLYKKIKFNFIGKFPSEYVDYINQYNIKEAICIKGNKPLREVLSEIKKSDYCLLVLNDVYSFNLSTKFFEYIAMKRKVVVLSNKGTAPEFIVGNNLGYWINPSDAFKNLTDIINKRLTGESQIWNSTYDIEQYSLESLTDKLIKVIEA